MATKRLFFDIETSPNIGFFWQPSRKANISHDNIIKERAIICICWKWQDEEDVYYLTWDKNQCDKAMLTEFMETITDADEVIGHNGDRYDIPWIRTRALFHRIDCPPSFASADTLKFSRSHFRFNSNRLDYIGKFLGLGGKQETGGFGLWKEIVLNNCKESMDKMVDYCSRDVRLLQEVFETINPYTGVKVHHGVLIGERRYSCPNCGSNEIMCNKTRTTVTGMIKREMKCKGCGKNYTIGNKVYQDYLADKTDWNNKKIK